MEDRKKLLIVDDSKENIRVLVEQLKRDYRLNALTDGFKALETAIKWKPDIVLLDVIMPEISGYDVCAQLKASPETMGIPVVFVTGASDPEEEIACLKTGALDYVTKPVNPKLLSVKINNFIEIKNQMTLLSGLLEAKKAEIEKGADKYLDFALKQTELTVDGAKEPHIKRCTEYAKILVNTLLRSTAYPELVSENMAVSICGAASFHDMDKYKTGGALVKALAKKTGDEEFAEDAAEIIMRRHERWDGSGQPDGLKGLAIPLGARIIALIEQYETLTSNRVYKEPTYHFEAVRTITSENGMGLDPGLVEEFLNVQEDFLQNMRKYADPETE